MPIIFAQPLIQFSGAAMSRISPDAFHATAIRWCLGGLQSFGSSLNDMASPVHIATYAVLIFFFSFFWVATQFNAVRIADDLKRNGSYIPGIRPGMATAEHLDMVMTRVTFFGALGLLIVAIVPQILRAFLKIPWELSSFFGGSSLLIIVGHVKDGMELARESNVDADVVVPVPDSGVPAALGFAAEAKIPFELGIIRNHYVGRTFIQPTDKTRHAGVKMKHNANCTTLKGKRVILVDDSIVRGTTSRKIVEMVRQAGAREVHMRISSPPTTHCCYFGIDTPERDELLAACYDIPGMANRIGVDSLAFVSLDGLFRAAGDTGRNPETSLFCDACFTGEYPIHPSDYRPETAGDSK